ncbi:MAG: F0F1 ATP synthase subunit delta, partial [Nitrospinota bacterium]|nr:F0F1 ATP synthase subunit delta [Nitrospinota bacterium]
MTGGEVARRYAKALVGIAEERGVLDETGADLKELADALLDHAGLRRVLENPRFPRETRTRIIESVLESSGTSPLL